MSGVDDQILEDAELIEGDDDGGPAPLLEPISYFGTDFDVHGLVRRLNNGDILVPSFDPELEGSDLAGFQRRFVWKRPQMDRFIESLLLGYPVPGVFLVKQADKKLLVLDGQQRLRTLRKFFRGDFELKTVSEQFNGLRYSDLDDDSRRALDNTFIHATVIRYSEEHEGDEAIYRLFERLNSGGTRLYPQEIRVALLNGDLVNLIRDLNKNEDWRALFGPVSPRLKDQELILRFISLYCAGTTYKRPLSSFLTKFLSDHRNLKGFSQPDVGKLFADVCRAVNSGVGNRAFRLTRNINAALVDAVMVGVANRLTKGPINDATALGPALDNLLKDDDFQAAIGRATADEARVRERLTKATAAFERVK